MEYSFARYLAAKKSVDDRALNGYVWRALRDAWPAAPPNVLEVGAGIGTMAERLAERGLPAECYTAIDADPTVIEAARLRPGLPPTVELETVDLYDFAVAARGRRAWDVLIAHAFLDLVDITLTLPILLNLLRPGGLFYFTVNFDGLSVFEPPVDPAFDEQVMTLYHRTMDERLIGGRPSGDSRTGRRLLSLIPALGGEILAAGSSDWVVWPGDGRYPGDEAYFLHHILHFVETSLAGRSELEPQRLAEWIARRRAQVEAGELIYLAHQLDVVGRYPASGGRAQR